MENNNSILSYKKNLAQVFSKAAHTYGSASFFEQDIGQRLLARLDIFKFTPKTILEVGSGAGYFSSQLATLFPNATLIQLDLAEGMLTTAKHSLSSHATTPQNKRDPILVCADIDAIPLASHSVDFIFSNCVFHWCLDLQTLFKELHRILTPEGLLLFSTLGPDTLKELRHCLESLNYPTYLQHFIDMHIIGDLLYQAHFNDPVMDVDPLTLTYSNFETALLELKQNGSYYLLRETPKGLTPKSFLPKLSELYYQTFKTPSGKFPFSFEVIYGHAFGSALKSKHAYLENNDVYTLKIKGSDLKFKGSDLKF